MAMKSKSSHDEFDEVRRIKGGVKEFASNTIFKSLRPHVGTHKSTVAIGNSGRRWYFGHVWESMLLSNKPCQNPKTYQRAG